MWRPAVLFFCLILSGNTATAGAWPRGQFNGFLSLSYEYTVAEDDLLLVLDSSVIEPRTFGYTAFYGDFGLTDRLTIGIDAGEEDAPDTRQTILFATYAIAPADWRHQVALELGIGEREFPADPDDRAHIQFLRDGGRERVIRPGISWGYGFQSGLGGGWAAIDARVELRRERTATIPKVDVTIGLSPNDNSTMFLQTQYSDYPLADPRIRLVPTYVRHLWHGVSLETALLYDAMGGDRVGVKAGLWLQF